MVRNNIINYLGISHNYLGTNCFTLIHQFYKNELNINSLEKLIPPDIKNRRWMKDISLDDIDNWALQYGIKVPLTDAQDFDVMIFIQPTSPMIKSKYINEGIKMIKSGKYDSVFTVTKEHWTPRWNSNVEPVDWDIHNRPRRQDKEDLYIENGMFYITKRDNLLTSKLRYSGRKGFVKIPLTDSFQIDTREDLDLIRKLI